MLESANHVDRKMARRCKFLTVLLFTAISACSQSDESRLDAAAAKCGISGLKHMADKKDPRLYFVDLPFVTSGFSTPRPAEYLRRQNTNGKINCLRAQLGGAGISVESSHPVIVE